MEAWRSEQACLSWLSLCACRLRRVISDRGSAAALPLPKARENAVPKEKDQKQKNGKEWKRMEKAEERKAK